MPDGQSEIGIIIIIIKTIIIIIKIKNKNWKLYIIASSNHIYPNI